MTQKSSKKRAALLVDNLRLCKWQSDALKAASDMVEVVMVLNCQNTTTKKNIRKHSLYYFLNFFALRNHLTRKRVEQFPNRSVINFSADYAGAWQYLPASICEELKRENIDVVIKFGMGLIHLSEDTLLPPILSYHHGDPSKYRGRPAGFYELLHGEKTTGIIVQALSNELDAGVIFAFAESRVTNFSYRKTAIELYSNSAPLLSKALANLFSGSPLEKDTGGKNYRLPSNIQVIGFVLLLTLNALKKIVYGLFIEKRWKVAATRNTLSLSQGEVISSRYFAEVPISKKYNFYADPFISADGKKIRLEALDNKTGLGDILQIDADDYSTQKVILSGEHFSYPFSFSYAGKEYLLPEVASHSAPYFCDPHRPNQRHFLRGLESMRIVDATMYFIDENWFLFFGEKHNAHGILSLWVADSPYDVFTPHPQSPIVMSPSEARMGGAVINYGDRILRFGQNNSGVYGESLAIMQISSLTTTSYAENKLGEVFIDNFHGPHSIAFSSDMKSIVLDYYSHEFSLLAGVRRIRGRFRRPLA